MKIEELINQELMRVMDEEITNKIEDKVGHLLSQIKEINSLIGRSDVWLCMKDIESQFGISIRSQYRYMNEGIFKFKKPYGGKRLILVESIIEFTNL